MKKSTKELALGIAAVAGATAIGTTAVHADTATPAAQSSEAVTSASANTVSDAQKAVDTQTENVNAAKTGLENAKSTAASAKSDLAAKSDAVAKDTADVTAKSAAASSANALSDQATSDAISKAKDAAASDSKDLDAAKSANEEAQKKAKTAADDASEADSDVEAQQDVVKKAQDNQSAAQKALDDAQAAKQNVADKSAAAQAANDAYNKALTADSDAKIKSDNAEKAMNDAISKTVDAKKALDAANADYAAKQKAQQDAQTALTNVQEHALDPTTELNKTGISVKVTDAAKSVAQKLNNGTKFYQLSKDDQRDIFTGVHFMYSPNGTDRLDKLGAKGQSFTLASLYRQLNDTAAVSVNQFLALALDGARYALGLHTGQVLVNPALQALSSSIYSINYDPVAKTNAVQTALSAAGLDANEDATITLGNDLVELASGTATQADLNHALISALNNIFSNEVNYESSLLATMLGLDTAGTTDPTYIGYMPDGTNHDNVLAVANANNIKNQQVINEGNSYPNVIASQSQNIDQLSQALTKANQDFSASQTAQKNAQQAYDDAYAEELSTTKANTEAKTNKDQTATTLAQATDAKQAADQALADAQKADNSDPAKITAAQNALTKAQSAVKEAQDKLAGLVTVQKTAHAKLTQANEAAAKTTQAVKDAQAKVDQDNAKVEALINAPKTAKDAAAALKAAQDKLATDQAALKDAQAKAAKAASDVEVAQQLVNDAQNALDQAVARYNTLKTIQDAKSEQEAQDNSYHISGTHVVDANGNVVPGWTYMGQQLVDPYGNVVPAGQTTPLQTVVTTSTSPVSSDTQQALPQTGDDNKAEVAAAGLGISTLAAMFGLASFKKREFHN